MMSFFFSLLMNAPRIYHTWYLMEAIIQPPASNARIIRLVPLNPLISYLSDVNA